MPKHWRMQPINKNMRGEVNGWDKPRTVPEALGKRLIKRAPQEWRVLEKDLILEGGVPQPGSLDWQPMDPPPPPPQPKPSERAEQDPTVGKKTGGFTK